MQTHEMYITPSIAQEYLDANKVNRIVSPSAVAKYSEDMKNDNWMLTHQGIAFYEDGSLADGQHRLLAVIKADKGVWMQVTTGMPKDNALAIDHNRPRSSVDSIRIQGLSDWIGNKEIAMINVIAHPKRLSTHEQLRWLNMLEKSAKFAQQKFMMNRASLTNAAIMAAITVAHNATGLEDELDHFCDVFYSGMSRSKYDDIIVRLRDEFMRNKNNGGTAKRIKYLKAQRAIQAFLNREPITKLIAPNDPIWTFNGGAEEFDE